jgi:hypothetical protein
MGLTICLANTAAEDAATVTDPGGALSRGGEAKQERNSDVLPELAHGFSQASSS